jgi:3-hydroxyisobutyrate dehydrogenase
MSAAAPTIAVLGTGTMGAPMARNLIAAEFPVTVWNREPEATVPLVKLGARLAPSASEAAAATEIVITMLTNGAAAEEVMNGPNGPLSTMRTGSIWIQMGTIGLKWTERLAAEAAEHGIEFVDAPVSGSSGPANDGELVVLASGPQELRAILEPVFAALGRKTLWLGPAGYGTRLKLVLNNWLATQVEALAETVALAEALDLRPSLVAETLADSPLGSPYAVAKGHAMADRQFEPGFALNNAFKDVDLALDAARAKGLELPLTSVLEPRWREAIANGHGDEDLSVVIEAATT